MTIYDDISAHIIGRIGITKVEADYLETLYKGFRGLHIEVGCLWGATALLAVLAKPAGHVVTIDYMKFGYWDDGDPDCNRKKPTPGAILDNLARFGVSHRVSVYKGPSYPFPLPNLKPDTAFIDAAHEFEGCVHDWQSLKDITKHVIIFHDYGTNRHPGVQRAVDEVARKDKGWKLREVVGTLAVFDRVK